MSDYKHMPIGVFDSGMGGISVLATLMKELPNERFIYFGDSINAPYGIKTVSEVKKFTLDACDFLISENVKAIVIACNTATSAAIKDLREKYTIPVVGMEPALKLAVESSINGDIAVMATPMTLKEKKFEQLMKLHMNERLIIKVPCPELVTLVEDKHINDSQVREAIEKCFAEINSESLGAIVLGCTHYIFLRDALKSIFPNTILLIDGNYGTAMQVKRLLNETNMLSEDLDGSIKRVVIKNSKSIALEKQSLEMLNMALR